MTEGFEIFMKSKRRKLSAPNTVTITGEQSRDDCICEEAIKPIKVISVQEATSGFLL